RQRHQSDTEAVRGTELERHSQWYGQKEQHRRRDCVRSRQRIWNALEQGRSLRALLDRPAWRRLLDDGAAGPGPARVDAPIGGQDREAPLMMPGTSFGVG